ncbi:MAG TPA: trypsin-like peptidase domain-containing protein [Mycobacteriales bacterium]
MSDERPTEPRNGTTADEPAPAAASPWAPDAAAPATPQVPSADPAEAPSAAQGNPAQASSDVPGSPDPAARPQPSPWWAVGAQRDPWRDPASNPAWIAPGAPPAEAPAPPDLPPPPARRGLGPLLSVALIAALLAGTLGGALGFAAAARFVHGATVTLGSNDPGRAPALADRPPNSVAGIVARVQPSVVSIEISTAGSRGNGSGFVVSKDGYIVTNNHVAAPAAAGGNLRVVFQDGTYASASIVGRDPNSDIAVLRIRRDNLPAVQFGDSDKVLVGDPVVAFGSPLGLQGTVTSGIISALDRPVVTGGEHGDEAAYMAAIQTDAAINPGNSGGPLVDGNGRVVGVNSAIATLASSPSARAGSIGLGFSIPINQAKRIAEQIIATGHAKRTIMAATLDMTYTDPAGGVRLQDVPDGPARRAGLRPGDVITEFDGRRVSDPTDLIALIRKFAAGTRVPVTYVRGGQTRTVEITLTETS